MIRSSLAGKQFILTLKSWGRLGEVVANLEGEARPVFVQGGIPGERVRIEIVREWRRYIAARTVEVIEASPERSYHRANILVHALVVNGSIFHMHFSWKPRNYWWSVLLKESVGFQIPL